MGKDNISQALACVKDLLKKMPSEYSDGLCGAYQPFAASEIVQCRRFSSSMACLKS